MSCSAYRTLDIQVFEPADISQWNEGKIALLDRNIRVNNKSVMISSDSYEDLLLIFKDGLNSVFIESERSDSVVPMIEKEMSFQNNIDFPKPLLAKYISQLCIDFGTDYIISLELLSYRIVHNKLVGDWFIRLYAHDSIAAIDSIRYSGTTGTIEDKAWEYGVLYAQRLIPHWEYSRRRVYNKGKALGVGDAFFRDDRFSDALQVWTAGLELSPRIAVKAAINIAWLYESRSDFENALYTLKNAQQLIDKKKIKTRASHYATEYLSIIQERMESSEQLKQQTTAADN